MTDIEQIKRSHESARPKKSNPAWCNTHCDLGVVLARNELLEAVLEAAQVPRHDYCGTDDWFIALDKAVYEATTDFGEQYRDKYADSGKQEPPEIFEGTREMLDRITKGGGG